MDRRRIFLLSFLLISILTPLLAQPNVRIKDITIVQGIRENQLIGIGLVTGLGGKGDSASNPLLQKTLAGFVSHFGLDIEQEDIKSKNCAVVSVTAQIPPFIREGDKIDVVVSSLGDAKSIDGGMLIQTNLKASNGKAYLAAQGIITSGDMPGSSKSVGLIPGGAIVERQVLSDFITNGAIALVLKHPDFTTANNIYKAIMAAFPEVNATVPDSSMVKIVVPGDKINNPVDFIAGIESLTVMPDMPGKVVINAKSGIVVMGKDVKIGKVAVSCRGAEISIGDEDSFFGDEETSEQFLLNDAPNVDNLVETLKTLGLDTDTIIEVLKAIDKAGALYGTLEIM